MRTNFFTKKIYLKYLGAHHIYLLVFILFISIQRFYHTGTLLFTIFYHGMQHTFVKCYKYCTIVVLCYIRHCVFTTLYNGVRRICNVVPNSYHGAPRCNHWCTVFYLAVPWYYLMITMVFFPRNVALDYWHCYS